MTLRIAVLISGKGSNLRALQEAIDAGQCDARVIAVISDRASAEGLAFAAERSIASSVISLRDYADRAAWDVAVANKLDQLAPELIVTAGFMRVLGAPVLARFGGRIINVHPALLPLFPGTTGPEQAIAAGVRVSGCTVHVVDAGVDTGPIIAQAVVRVLPSDTSQTLHERIQHAEHTLLPSVVAAIARGAIVLQPSLRVQDAVDDARVLISPLWNASGSETP